MSSEKSGALMSEQEYRQRILDLCDQPLRKVRSVLADNYGQPLAETYVSKVDLPSFRNSAMDGYAVRAEDTRNVPVTLQVTGDVPAGSPGDVALTPGTAMRIMTGAPIPPGADAVVRVEWTNRGTDQVTITKSVTVGAEIREAGEDLRKGDSVGVDGDVTSPGRIGLLAASGHDQVFMWGPAHVGVVATGDELYPVGIELPPGGIYDSNSHQGRELVKRAGGVVSERITLTDDIDEAVAQLRELAQRSDLIVTSGGVSAGSYEVVKDVFNKLGGGIFTGVDIQPGKPQGYGVIDETPVVCLPGNPVSAFVSFELFVRPLIRKMGGHKHYQSPEAPAKITADLKRAPHRTRYLPATLDWNTMTVETPHVHGSHRVSVAAAANCLIRIPGMHLDAPGSDLGDVLSAGSTVRVVLLDPLT
ncbi:MAG: gephyrin-like molybdotransferase Glp [Candidatus Nanopelagicales bacterium]